MDTLTATQVIASNLYTKIETDALLDLKQDLIVIISPLVLLILLVHQM
jgi:hypothetical protein